MIDKNKISDVEAFLKMLETFRRLKLLPDDTALEALRTQLLNLIEEYYK